MTDDNPYAPPRSQLQDRSVRVAAATANQRWPKIFGIISCIMAGQGIVFSPLLVLFNYVNPASDGFLDLLPDWYHTFTVGSTLASMAFSVALLFGGLMLIKKRPLGGTLHLAYSGLELFLVLLGTVLYFVAASEIDPYGLSGAEEAGVVGGSIGGVFGAIIGAAYPIFLFIWFGREKIRNDIADWGD
ncbi:MAG: hypothetical protein JRF63_08735 [Deltaproteobacteria bacterium]|nr:hypothetical protein [Deltaproteobacteria bacterium]